MSTNISKEKREKLVQKISAIKQYISSSTQDENTAKLLAYIADIEKDIKGKKYGLVFEEHRENIDEILENNLPVLTEDTDLFIDNGGQMNFLIEGDNLASLQLLEKTHKGKIDLIYIDPPYNTGAKDWKYDNNYVDGKDLFCHSKWLSMMNTRLVIAKKLLSENGVLIVAIDKHEQATLSLLLDNIFGHLYQQDCITIIHNPRGVQGNNFSYIHEYAIFVHKTGLKNIDDKKLNENEIDYSQLRNWGGESLREDAKNCFYPIIVKDDAIIGFGDVLFDMNIHPKKTEKHGDEYWVYPIDRNGIERKWRYAKQSVETIKQYLKPKKIADDYDILLGKPAASYKTVWSDTKYDANQYGTKLVNDLVVGNTFNFPKSLWNTYDCLYATVAKKTNAIVLDFFAGSGTTGHAVMELNKQDGGKRKFILCTNNENDICRDITYERIKTVITGKRKDGTTYGESHSASLKYFKVDYLPISDKLYYEYADEILKHVRELVELENGINFIGNTEIAIILTEEELDEFVDHLPKTCKAIYVGHDVLPTEKQERIFEEKKIKINIIPEYYYRDLEG